MNLVSSYLLAVASCHGDFVRTDEGSKELNLAEVTAWRMFERVYHDVACHGEQPLYSCGGILAEHIRYCSKEFSMEYWTATIMLGRVTFKLGNRITWAPSQVLSLRISATPLLLGWWQ